MTLRFSLPREQVFSDTGTPLPGAQLFFYAAGTSAPKLTYADAALTIPNGNPVVADAGGRFPDVFFGPGSYRAVLKTAAGVTVWDADPIEGDNGGSGASATATANLLINGSFRINQRAATSVADDAYCLDRWYVLTQSGNATVAQITTPESGQANAIRLTQPDVTAKRLGLAQIIESADCRHLRGGKVTLAGRVRHSLARPIRYAILEWTGAADAVTSDVVADWTSSLYTSGGFFQTSSLIVNTVGTLTPSANVWTDLPALTATLSTATNNIIVFVWTEGATNQNATLDLGAARCVAGDADPGFQPRPMGQELALCRRFYHSTYPLGTAPGTASVTPGLSYAGITGSHAETFVPLPERMRGAPTVTAYSATSGASGVLLVGAGDAAVTPTATETSVLLTTTDLLASNAVVAGHLTANAEL